MKRNLLGMLLIAASCCVSVRASASETLSIPYFAGSMNLLGDTCGTTPEGAVKSLGSGHFQCMIDVPIPLASGHTIKQITIFYGTDGTGPTEVNASLRYKDLRTFTNVGAIDTETEFWSTTINVSSAAVASANLLAQSGLPPIVNYPDAFVIDINKAYFVTVVLGANTRSEFYGMKVLYD